ncbi:MAG: tetratricopeptide repeat protein [Gammaproteobacteria bacterium]|nr:tetratricopeptide repeat protein [Gammaproteobacteria bacterium]
MLAASAASFLLMGPLYPAWTSADERTDVLERAVEADREDASLRLRLAEAYSAAGRTDEAIGQYRIVIEIAGEDSSMGREASRSMRYLIATRHAERQELDQAVEIFAQLAREYPDNALIHYSVGVAQMLRGESDEASAAFERVIELDPNYISAYVNLASVHEARGELERAVERLAQAVELAPGSAAGRRAEVRLLAIEARLLGTQGNLHEAIATYQRALEIEPKDREALTGAAASYRGLGDVTGELEIYRRIVAAYPDDVASRLRLAELSVEQANFHDAYEQLEVVARQGPKDTLAARMQDILRRLNSTEAGRKVAEERLLARIARQQERVRAAPEDSEAWRELALLQLQHGDEAEAAASFEAIRGINPNDWRIRFALASLYDNLGRFAEAAEEYAAVLELEADEPTRERALGSLQSVIAKRMYVEGRFSEASQQFEEILALDPDNELAHFYLGLIYSQEEQILRAVDAYQEVIRIVPTHVGARLNLAASYERLNREEDAISEYTKILQANPSPQIAEMARRAMDSARRRMRGISVNAGYLMAWDDNTNLGDQRRVEDFRSDLSLNLAYQYKTEGGVRWRLLLAPTYSTYHRGQFDYLHTTATVSAGLTRGRYNLLGGYTHRSSEGLLAESRVGRMNTLFAEGFTRLTLPSVRSPFKGDWVPSSVSATLSLSDFDGESSPFFSARTAAAGVSIAQSMTPASQLRMGYQYVINDNKLPIGNDYAYTMHGLSLGLDYRTSWGGLNANYGLSLLDYINPDSFSQFTRHRRNTRHSLATGVRWRFRENVGLFATAAYTLNNSNLPVGFILGAEDIIEGLQSSSLSDYHRLIITTGMTLSF